MKLTIESTNITTRIDDVPVRLWEGVTPTGVRCKVFVHRIACDAMGDTAEFDKQLREQLPPAEVMIPLEKAIDFRLVS
jgi:hypothetical protein